MIASTTLLPAIGVCGSTSEVMNRTRPMIAAVSIGPAVDQTEEFSP